MTLSGKDCSMRHRTWNGKICCSWGDPGYIWQRLRTVRIIFLTRFYRTPIWSEIRILGEVESKSAAAVEWILHHHPLTCDAYAPALPLYYLIAALVSYEILEKGRWRRRKCGQGVENWRVTMVPSPPDSVQICGASMAILELLWCIHAFSSM